VVNVHDGFDCLLRIGPSHTERQGFTPFFPPPFQFEKGTTYFLVFIFHDGKFVDNILFDNGSQITKVHFHLSFFQLSIMLTLDIK
jgi:hypothetical protein